jgi:hypothetical protein
MARFYEATPSAWAQWPQEWPNMTDMQVWADTIWARKPTHTFIPLGENDVLQIEKRLPGMHIVESTPSCLFMRSTTPHKDNRFTRYHATNFRVADQIANSRAPFKGKILCGWSASKGKHKKAMHGVYISDTYQGALHYIHGSKSLGGLAALLIVEGKAAGTTIAGAGSNRVWTTDMLCHDLMGMVILKSINCPQTAGMKPTNQHSSFLNSHCDQSYRDFCCKVFNLDCEGYMLEPPVAITDVFTQGSLHQQDAREKEDEIGVSNLSWTLQRIVLSKGGRQATPFISEAYCFTANTPTMPISSAVTTGPGVAPSATVHEVPSQSHITKLSAAVPLTANASLVPLRVEAIPFPLPVTAPNFPVYSPPTQAKYGRASQFPQQFQEPLSSTLQVQLSERWGSREPMPPSSKALNTASKFPSPPTRAAPHGPGISSTGGSSSSGSQAPVTPPKDRPLPSAASVILTVVPEASPSTEGVLTADAPVLPTQPTMDAPATNQESSVPTRYGTDTTGFMTPRMREAVFTRSHVLNRPSDKQLFLTRLKEAGWSSIMCYRLWTSPLEAQQAALKLGDPGVVRKLYGDMFLTCKTLCEKAKAAKVAALMLDIPATDQIRRTCTQT